MAHDVYIAGASYKGVSIVILADTAGHKYRYIDEEEVGDGFFTLDIEGDLIPKNETTWSQCFKLDTEGNIVLQDAPGASKYFGPDQTGDITLASDGST